MRQASHLEMYGKRQQLGGSRLRNRRESVQCFRRVGADGTLTHVPPAASCQLGTESSHRVAVGALDVEAGRSRSGEPGGRFPWLETPAAKEGGAPVSRQAHALLDVDGNGGGLGQQHSELLPCLRHVGVSRDYRPVYSAACRRGSGGCLGHCRMGNVSRWHNEKLPSQVTSAAISMGQQSRRLEEVASVSRQAHALLDADGNGGGLGQQHRELLPCLRHVGVSRGTVLLPNSAVTTSGCVRGKGRLQLYGGRRAEADLPSLPHLRPVCKKRECPRDRVLRSSGRIARKAPHCQQGGHVQLCQRVVRGQQGRSVVHRPVRGGHQGVGGAAGHHVLYLEEELLHCCCIPVPAAAPVSRQAHALLDIGAIGGGLEQQPSQLLAAMPSSRGCELRRRRTSQPPRLLRGLRVEEMRVPQCRFSAVSVLKAAAVDANRGPGGSTQGTEPAPPLSAPPQGSFAQGIQDCVCPTATQLLPATTSTNGAASCSASNGHGDATASLPSTRTRAPSKNTPAADISSRRFTHLRGKIIGTAAMEHDEEWQRVLDKMFFENSEMSWTSAILQHGRHGVR
ncbi:uncharacterized protein LOC144102586 [Amblyomma americanum]